MIIAGLLMLLARSEQVPERSRGRPRLPPRDIEQ
jgi:hypothetical protein